MSNQELLSVSFNENGSTFTIGTQHGFELFQSDPLQKLFYYKDQGGIAIAEPLRNTNIVFLTGGGSSPAWNPNKVMVWDDKKKKVIAEMEFPKQVIGMLSRSDRLLVRTNSNVYIYNVNDLQLINRFLLRQSLVTFTKTDKGDTIVLHSDIDLTAFVVRYIEGAPFPQLSVQAHQNNLAALAISDSGQLASTCSELGTLIRIWSTANGNLIKQLRRGIDQVRIQNLVFHPSGTTLLVSSDKGTIHIFTIQSDNELPKEGALLPVNKTSSLSWLSGVLPDYFSSEWSACSYSHLPNTSCIVEFGPQPNTIIVINITGEYTRYHYTSDEIVIKERLMLLN